MIRTRFPRLSLSFPLLFLGIVALPLMLQERNAAGPGGLCDAACCHQDGEDASRDGAQGDQGEEDGQEAGFPALPRDAGSCPGEAGVLVGSQPAPVAWQLRADEFDSGLPWWIECPYPLELYTGSSSSRLSGSAAGIPAAFDPAVHPPRGPPAA